MLRTLIVGVFLTVEITFLIANAVKFEEGGWISIALGLLLMGLMLFWHWGETIKADLIRYDSLINNLPLLQELSNDLAVPKFATHLVYLTTADKPEQIESETLYSILNRAPKRADVYWFIHVCVEDDPYLMDYRVDELADQDAYFITFYLGFRVEPRINLLFRMVVERLVENKEIIIESRYKSSQVHRVPGDFRFVLFRPFLSTENDLPLRKRIIMRGYSLIRRIAMSTKSAFGLDTSNVVVEDVPLVLASVQNVRLNRLPSKLNAPKA